MGIGERLGWAIISFVFWVGIGLLLVSLRLANGEVEQVVIALLAGLAWFGSSLIIWEHK